MILSILPHSNIPTFHFPYPKISIYLSRVASFWRSQSLDASKMHLDLYQHSLDHQTQTQTQTQMQHRLNCPNEAAVDPTTMCNKRNQSPNADEPSYRPLSNNGSEADSSSWLKREPKTCRCRCRCRYLESVKLSTPQGRLLRSRVQTLYHKAMKMSITKITTCNKGSLPTTFPSLKPASILFISLKDSNTVEPRLLAKLACIVGSRGLTPHTTSRGLDCSKVSESGH